MNRLKNLEIKKLLKELEFIESDYEYRSEIVSDADSNFMRSVNEFLDKNPKLKSLYDKKVTDRIDKVIREKKKEVIQEEPIVNENEDDFIEDDPIDNVVVESKAVEVGKASDIRKFYREIVKLTHPDKVDDKNLNDIYIKATDYYNNSDKVGLYKICGDLGIHFEIDENDADFIEDKINTLKNKINFLESTFTWRWFNSKEDKIKQEIVLDFIRLKIY